ncbi:preprotein translocase subunit SecA [Proteocatella sphenisci]|uniref:preprotein translocase subunit SecA n=1 Tax=Proteocatella sphenisci TaxID=181070 RepID=UPI00048FC27B|nr:preprotein translocase subunit SecA [Proteocatella sphenisci]
MGLLDNILSKREIKKLEACAQKINALESRFEAMTDSELKAMTPEFKNRLQNGETVDDILEEAFAACREGAKRSLGMRHYDVQLMGGMVLNSGRIAEMRTGEGKTLVATLAVYLNALEGKGVHVVTVNDYLAKRDCEWMGKLYNFMGLTTGVIVHGITNEQRRAAYRADITYGTNNEYGFDYLRDNMVIFENQRVQRPLNYAIVDEVDSILVDEARTPLIISGAGDKSTSLYTTANSFIQLLKLEEDYIVNEKDNASSLTDEGLEKAEKFFGVDSMTDIANIEVYHHIGQALRANTLMRLDVDYVIKDGEIVIVDEFTGRLMFGRRYSEGLHQAIEAKEGLKIQRESKTLATITFQNYFRMYKKLSGMTGTAKTEEDEFRSIYKMDVVQIPTNKPTQRNDMDDAVYKNVESKFRAVVEHVAEVHKTGQPILIGTISIETSEMLSEMLKRKGVKHEVLNAKNHEKEADIVAQAGRYEAVTIATNMAGRGTDIILGGNPEILTVKEMKKREYEEHLIAEASGFSATDDEEIKEARKVYQEILAQKKLELKEEQVKVISAGGLFILGTERHESRRIDNQLRGRAGRQGDPGTTRFFISLEDELMRLFGSERIQGVVEKLGMEEEDAIEHKMLSKSIESAQKKVEGKNFSIRKSVLQYDDVMNKQREIIYAERKRVLEGENIKPEILEMIDALADDIVDKFCSEKTYQEEWDIKGLKEKINQQFAADINIEEEISNIDNPRMKTLIKDMARKIYEMKESMLPEEEFRELERVILLQVVDSKWMDHIDSMDQLRQGMGLRAIGQEDPVRAYQIEGFDMFDAMTESIKEETVKYLMSFQIQKEEEKQQVQIQRKAVVDLDKIKEGFENSLEEKSSTPKKTDKVVGRNEECPCGSGKKYKKCCGKD